MRCWLIFLKTWREMRRDWIILALTLAFAPFFVFLYWLFTYGGSTSYSVLVINQDLGVKIKSSNYLSAGNDILDAINAITYADGRPLLKAIEIDSYHQAEELLRNRSAAAFLVIPENFSDTLYALQSGDRNVSTEIVFGGDLTNPYYMVAANLAITAVDFFVQQETGQEMLIQYVEEPLGASGARTEFENYVPGMLVFAVILLVFLASMTVAKEIETGTLRRLQLTPATSFDVLSGISAALVLVGIIAIVIAFLTAILLGFRSQGPLWIAILIGSITSLSIIGTGMIVACFSHTVSQTFVIANFPLGLYMFFSGAIFPIPKATLFTIGDHAIGLYDILPPTHAVVALNKVLTLGAELGNVIYELSVLLILSLIYFSIGVWFFNHNHMHR